MSLPRPALVHASQLETFNLLNRIRMSLPRPALVHASQLETFNLLNRIRMSLPRPALVYANAHSNSDHRSVMTPFQLNRVEQINCIGVEARRRECHFVNSMTAVPENDDDTQPQYEVSGNRPTSVFAVPVNESIENFIDYYTRLLREENERLKYRHYCIRCREEVRSVVFMSCLYPHLLTCQSCANHYDRCPICNTVIKDLLYLPRE